MIKPFEKLLHPEKYAESIEIKKIVAAPKLHKDGVERYKKHILEGKSIKPIVVLKHPHEEVYAVLDGHHRFYAFLELGAQTIDAAVIRSNKFIFNKTKDGWLQPTPAMTKYIHVPVLVFAKYINEFIKKPKKHLKISKIDFEKFKYRISSLKKKKILKIK
jgi:hypothetical protein